MPDASGPPDAPLVDVEAWLHAHGDRLLRSAWLLCGDRSEAQDLVQETLLQAVKSGHRFRGESAVYTWLHGILLNLSRRHWRKRKRLVYDEARVLEATCQSDPDTALDREFHVARLTAAIQALSPEHREVVVLRYFEDLKLHDIAARTGASLGTVKSRLHYAIRCLERHLPEPMNFITTEGTQDQGIV